VIVVAEGLEYGETGCPVGAQAVEYGNRKADSCCQVRISVQRIAVSIEPVKQGLVITRLD
jgi:hypothetical protein